jgi:hypothetical protein
MSTGPRFDVLPETQGEIKQIERRGRAPKRSQAAGTIVNDRILDAWWNQLSRAQRIELYTSNRIIKLEGTVS